MTDDLITHYTQDGRIPGLAQKTHSGPAAGRTPYQRTASFDFQRSLSDGRGNSLDVRHQQTLFANLPGRTCHPLYDARQEVTLSSISNLRGAGAHFRKALWWSFHQSLESISPPPPLPCMNVAKSEHAPIFAFTLGFGDEPCFGAAGIEVSDEDFRIQSFPILRADGMFLEFRDNLFYSNTKTIMDSSQLSTTLINAGFP